MTLPGKTASSGRPELDICRSYRAIDFLSFSIAGRGQVYKQETTHVEHLPDSVRLVHRFPNDPLSDYIYFPLSNFTKQSKVLPRCLTFAC